ncbi:MAG: hypothetical protein GVX96_07250 [Bacteroidetes bacterium]|jgi:hypothetical protein|nr:hypothetical protein [Bacteroidota bacterium]
MIKATYYSGRPRFFLCRTLLTTLFIFTWIGQQWGQRASWEQRPTLQMGIEAGFLVESQLLQNFSSSLTDQASNITLITNTQAGIRFGGFLRWRFYNNQNLESGIYRISRRYNAIAEDATSGEDFAEEEVNSVGYEIPFIWTVGIRTSNSGYLYAGFGGIASFLASNFGSFRGDIQLSGIADPRFVAGMVAIVGYEWDWGRSGGLYIGGQFQHSFGRMGRMNLRYRSGTETIADGNIDLNGAYLSAVFRYMLPGS